VAWWLPLAAGLAMYVQDVLATVMVVAEARGRAHLAASMDSLGWLAQITTTTVSVDALLTGSLAAKAAVVLAVSLGNYAGTYSGVKLGHRLMPDAAVIAP
jgi:hypothetical protein